MLSCTMITLKRIRSIRYRLELFHNKKKSRIHRSIDRHLIMIILVQVGLGVLLTSFRCGFLLYGTLTYNIAKDSWRRTIEMIFDKLSLTIYYMNFAKSFPVNMLTSPLFRHGFCQKFACVTSFKKDTLL